VVVTRQAEPVILKNKFNLLLLLLLLFWGGVFFGEISHCGYKNNKNKFRATGYKGFLGKIMGKIRHILTKKKSEVAHI